MDKKENAIYITTDYITLGQFLKLANVISTGGETKNYLENKKVLVNGDIENRRGKKIYPGTIVTAESKVFEIKHK